MSAYIKLNISHTKKDKNEYAIVRGPLYIIRRYRPEERPFNNIKYSVTPHYSVSYLCIMIHTRPK